MSSAFIASLTVASQKIYIYCGIPILIIGLIGDCLNIIVFLSLKTFRESSCAFYLLIMSIVNIGQLITGLLSRIMITSFTIDWTQTSLFYCKIRQYLVQTAAAISFACACLATIDQYFATSTRPRWQQWSHIKIARRLLTLISFLLMIAHLPLIIYYDQIQSPVSGQIVCTNTNAFLIQYNTYFNYLTLTNIIPYIITFSFGIMAYRNVQQIAHRTLPLVRRELDKQLTTMVLVQVVYNFITLVPNLIVYTIILQGSIHDLVIKAQVSLIYTVTLCLYYLYFAVSVDLSDEILFIF